MTDTPTPADPRGMELIDAYIKHLERSSDSKQTPRDRRGILERLHRELPFGIGQVSSEDLAAWLYRPEWSQNTKATYYRCIRSFYAWASNPEDPWIDGNPAARLPKVATAASISRACTDDQLAAILRKAPGPIRLWAIIAAYQGLRAGEIAGLDREHITERQLIVVRGKGGRPRSHDTDPNVWTAVKDLPNGPIARRLDNGKRASAHYVSAETRYYFHRLGVPTSLHPLRHWLGTTVQREYRDIRTTQAILGHKSLSSTQIYTASTDEQQRAARATLPRLADG